VADRFNRYKLLLLTQVVSMVQALLLTALIFFKHYSVWEIIALSVVLGIINAFDVPARQSLVYEMVEDKKDLPNALALNSSMVNLSRLIGPGIGNRRVIGAAAITGRQIDRTEYPGVLESRRIGSEGGQLCIPVTATLEGLFSAGSSLPSATFHRCMTPPAVPSSRVLPSAENAMDPTP